MAKLATRGNKSWDWYEVKFQIFRRNKGSEKVRRYDRKKRENEEIMQERVERGREGREKRKIKNVGNKENQRIHGRLGSSKLYRGV